MDYDTTSLAAGINKGLDRFDRSYQNGKIADSIVRVNPEVLQMLGMSKEQFGGLSSDDRTSMVSGAITGITLSAKRRQEELQAQELQARLKDYAAQAAERSGIATDRDAMTGFARDYAAGPAAAPPAYDTDASTQMPAGGPPTPDQLQKLASGPSGAGASPQARVNYALQRNPGAFGAREFFHNVGALQSLGAPPAPLGQAQPIPGVPGSMFVQTGAHGGQVVTLPAQQTQPQAFPIENPDQPSVIVDRKGGTHVYTPRATPEKTSTFMQTKVDLKRSRLADLDGQIAEMETQIAKQGGGTKTGLLGKATFWGSTLEDKLKALYDERDGVEKELQSLAASKKAAAKAPSKASTTTTNAGGGISFDDFQKNFRQ